MNKWTHEDILIALSLRCYPFCHEDSAIRVAERHDFERMRAILRVRYTHALSLKRLLVEGT